MPTYQYACTECGDRSEVVQRFSDDPLTACSACGGKLRKVFSPVGIVFKGSGFYRTDSRNGSSTVAAGNDGAANGSNGANGSSSDSSAKGESAKGESAKGESAKGDSAKGGESARKDSVKSDSGSSSSSSSGSGSRSSSVAASTK